MGHICPMQVGCAGELAAALGTNSNVNDPHAKHAMLAGASVRARQRKPRLRPFLLPLWPARIHQGSRSFAMWRSRNHCSNIAFVQPVWPMLPIAEQLLGRVKRCASSSPATRDAHDADAPLSKREPERKRLGIR